LFIWWSELLAEAWPLPIHIVPAALRLVLFDTVILKAIGVAAWLAALVVYGLALRAMGDSWRIGIGSPAPLVTGGVFAWSRNPIYLSFDLAVVGTFLIQGRLIFLIVAMVLAGALAMIIRQEERFLTRTHGDAYRRYQARVGRYVSWRRRRVAARNEKN
jgi:protein-S-isoprenylcysteine O-methyltransferase Ste14